MHFEETRSMDEVPTLPNLKGVGPTGSYCVPSGLEGTVFLEAEFMSRLRILLLAPGSNPEEVSMPYVTYSHAAALAQLHDVALVVGSRTEEPVRRAKAPFRSIEVVRM